MKIRTLFGIGISIGALVSLSFVFGFFSGLENFFEDTLSFSRPVHPNIVIVSIDDESLSRLGQWPWPREYFARALSALEKYSPRAVGIDVVFAEPSRAGFFDDGALAEALRKVAYPVIFPVEAQPLLIEGSRATAGKFLKPIPLFENDVVLGSANLVLDTDGIVRRVPVLISGENIDPGFNAFAYEVVKNSGLPIPDEESLSPITRIAYSAAAGHVRHVPFWRLLEKDALTGLDSGIIFIGATAADLHDTVLTPFSRGTEMPGVEVQANIANMLLQGHRLIPLSPLYMILWIFVAALIPVLVFHLFKRSVKPLLINIIIGLLHAALFVYAFEEGVVANFLHMQFAWMLSTAALFAYRYFYGEKERKALKDVFSKYVSQDVLAEILKNPEGVKLGGEEKEITVLFSDIRGFTTLSESLPPQKLVKILNEYFTKMTGEVLKHGGVLDKYIGDAVMAFWGAPLPDADQADHALAAARGMIEELEKLNQKFRDAGTPEIHIGIGLYTGPAVVGNIGSDLRFDYTAMGDTVNVASRLEGLTKEYKTAIILGESTMQKLSIKNSVQSLGAASVKGRNEALNIYTV